MAAIEDLLRVAWGVGFGSSRTATVHSVVECSEDSMLAQVGVPEHCRSEQGWVYLIPLEGPICKQLSTEVRVVSQPTGTFVPPYLVQNDLGFGDQ